MPDRAHLSLDAEALGRTLGARVVAHGEVGSTMDEAARDRDPRPVVHIAERQRAGRGRRGRRWASPAGNLYATIAWPETPSRLPPAILAAVQLSWAEAIHAAGGPRATCRWPNDGFLDGRKWAGALAVRGKGPEGEELRLGLGANLTVAPREMDAIALEAAWPGWPGQGAVTRLLLSAALDVLREGTEGVLGRLDRWPAFDELAPGEPLTLEVGGALRRGAYAGLAPDGRLRLVTEAGLETIPAGDLDRLRPG